MTYKSLSSSAKISTKGQNPTTRSWHYPTNDPSSGIYLKFHSDGSETRNGVHFQLRCVYPSLEVKSSWSNTKGTIHLFQKFLVSEGFTNLTDRLKDITDNEEIIDSVIIDLNNIEGSSE